jgi:hypothetical protein
MFITSALRRLPASSNEKQVDLSAAAQRVALPDAGAVIFGFGVGQVQKAGDFRRLQSLDAKQMLVWKIDSLGLWRIFHWTPL